MLSSDIVAALIGSASAVVISIAGFAVVWGRVKQQISNDSEDIEKLFHSIYKSNGTLVYVTEHLCKERTTDMQHDLKEIKRDIRDMRENFQTFQKQYEEYNRELSFNIGSLLSDKSNKPTTLKTSF